MYQRVEQVKLVKITRIISAGPGLQRVQADDLEYTINSEDDAQPGDYIVLAKNIGWLTVDTVCEHLPYSTFMQEGWRKCTSSI